MWLSNSLTIAMLIVLSFTQALSAKTLFCERYRTSGVHFMSPPANLTKQDSFDQWMPETLIFNQNDIDAFTEKPGSKSIFFERKTNIVNLGTVFTQVFQLLPNKKLLTKHPQGSQVSAKYNCDLGAQEVLAFKNAQQVNEPATRQSKTITDVISKLNDKEICKASKQGYSAHKKEALRRGLDCAAPTTLQKGNDNVNSSTTMSLKEAKAECASLGFTAGTEKHGDCVMKLMD